MEQKIVRTEIKQSGAEGGIEAQIATLGVVDHDGDIVEPGALDGKSASIIGAHRQDHVPLGKVKVEERGDAVVAVGQFNLGVREAKDWHEAVKFDLAHPPAVQEWSWGYSPIDSSEDTVGGERVRRLLDVDLIEVSPVLRGASIGSRTIGAKSIAKRHKTETSDAPWTLSGDGPDAIYASARAKLFPHHFVDGDKAGPASLRACLAGIAALKGARGVAVLSDREREAIYNHLSGHLEDAGIDPPKLDGALRLVDQLRLATYDAESVMSRLRDLSWMRGDEGKGLSEAAVAEALELATAIESLDRAARQSRLMAEHVSPRDAVAKAVAGWAAVNARA